MTRLDGSAGALLARHAFPLNALDAARAVAGPEPWRRLCAGATVVGLGEAAHGAAEFFAAKRHLIEMLVTEFGFTHVAIEAGEAGCEAIDAYIRYGAGDAATALTGQGYVAWDTTEMADLLAWMRTYNSRVEPSRRIGFVGLDHGYNAHGRDLVRRCLQEVAPELLAPSESTFSRLDDLEAGWPFRLGDQESAELAHAHKVLAELRARLQAVTDQSSLVARAIRALDRMSDWTGPHRNDRSCLMGGNLISLLHRETSAKVVVWAHNGHIGFGTVDGGVSLGDIARRELGEAYVAVALEFGQGTARMRRRDSDGHSSALESLAIPAPPADSLPWELDRLGALQLLVDLRRLRRDPEAAAWRTTEHAHHSVGWTTQELSTVYHRGPVAEEYDAILFVSRVGPTHPTPGAERMAATRAGY